MVWRNPEFLKALECKVLVIGAGGIGSELLKNLALTGFNNINVIDLDTIDISNLNRQFLFRKEHVGKGKAEVASAAVKAISPDVNIDFFHESIFNEKFGVSFFQQFAIVLSALDNKGARSHVNRLCLVSGVPLIESGSAGYLGQVSVIMKGKSECYDCVPKSGQKTYPNCTIRNTPSEPIHCVVWAKALFNQLFGEKDPDNDVAPEIDDSSSAQNLPGSSESKPNRIDTRTFAENSYYDAALLFNKLFHDDVNYLLKMADLWKERKKPTAVLFCRRYRRRAGRQSRASSKCLLGVNKWAEVYENSMHQLYEKYKLAAKDNGILSWDKDDEPSMNFVAACANIRSHIFSIASKSLFDVKSMAGNIIPAIATTNACVAGMIVIEALKIVRGQFDKSKNVFIGRVPNPRGKILVDEPPYKPNPKCYVCSDKREVFVKLNLEQMQVKQFRSKILLDTLNMLSPDVTDLFSQRVLISSEEGETDGTQFDCDDFVQQLEFKVIVFHSADLEVDDFEILSNNTVAKPEQEVVQKQPNGNEAEPSTYKMGEVSLDNKMNGISEAASGNCSTVMEVDTRRTSDELKRKRRSSFEDGGVSPSPKRSHVE